MTRLANEEAVRRATTYPHAVLSFLDADAFPTSVAAPFVADPSTATVELGPLSDAVVPRAPTCVTMAEKPKRRNTSPGLGGSGLRPRHVMTSDVPSAPSPTDPSTGRRSSGPSARR